MRNHLIVFRRKELNKDTYVEDLKVRRNMISRILLLLTKKGCRGEGHEHEPLHQYYTAFEWCQDNLDALPEEDVPEDLHFENLNEDPKHNILNEDEFVTWLTEGRFDLELSQLLSNQWLHNAAAKNSDSLHDYFATLRDELKNKYQDDEDFELVRNDPVLHVNLLARFIYETCVLNF